MSAIRNSSGAVPGRISSPIWAIFVWLCVVCWAAAQGRQSSVSQDAFGANDPTFRTRSNLVLVPVFVFSREGLDGLVTPDETRCAEEENNAFLGLLPDQPFLARLCAPGQVNDLTLNDFSLFQDGKPEKINSVAKEFWWLPVRDNRVWHVETSDEPSGIWSSADLDHSILPSTRGFYLLGFVPDSSEEGCHRIRVEVRRPGVRVFARDEYCQRQSPSDLLAATKIGEKLERELGRRGKGKIPLSVQAGTFHSGPDRQFVDVVAEFPWNRLSHFWDESHSRLHASIGVMGIVYTKDGKRVTQFSDLLWPSYWPTIITGWQSLLASLDGLGVDTNTFGSRLIHVLLKKRDPAYLPSRYETQLELPPGEYRLRVVLSDGAKTGLAEAPLTVQKAVAGGLATSSVLLCKRFRDAHVAAMETAAANFAPRYVPLVSKGIRVTPAGDTEFKAGEPLIPYFEIYPPNAGNTLNPKLQAHLRIVESKNGAIVKDFPPVDAGPYAQPGSSTIPIAREVPIAELPAGEYRLEVQAMDPTGRSTPWQTASFSIGDKKSSK